MAYEIFIDSNKIFKSLFIEAFSCWHCIFYDFVHNSNRYTFVMECDLVNFKPYSWKVQWYLLQSIVLIM